MTVYDPLINSIKIISKDITGLLKKFYKKLYMSIKFDVMKYFWLNDAKFFKV